MLGDGQGSKGTEVLLPNESSSKGYSPSIWRYIFIVQLVDLQALLIGYTTGFTSPTIKSIKNDLDICPGDDTDTICNDAKWVVSVINLSALCGGLVGGRLADAYGRRTIYLVNIVVFLGGYVLLSVSNDLATIITARLLCGLATGTASAVIPCYVAEISPPNVRGILLSLCNLNISIGILLVSLLWLGVESDTSDWWRGMALIAAVPAVIGGIGMWMLPETPTHLVRGKRFEEAKKALRFFHGSSVSIEDEIDALHAAGDAAQGGGESYFHSLRLLTEPRHYRPALMGIGVVSAFGASGIKAVLGYTASILKDAGADVTAGSVGFGAAQIVMSLVAMKWLLERFGRKPLLSISLVGNAVCLFALGFTFYAENHLNVSSSSVAWLPVVSLVTFISFTAIGQGSLAWAYSSEVCPKRVRGAVVGLAMFMFWSISFLESQFFQPGFVQFWIYGAVCLMNSVFVYRYAYETKGKNLAEIEAHFYNSGAGSSLQSSV